MDYMISQDKKFVAAQLFRFIPYTYEPASSVFYQMCIRDRKLAEAKNLTKVGMNDFIEAGFISANQLVKVLGNGSLTTQLDVEANAFSKSAVAAIEAVGGNAVKL